MTIATHPATISAVIFEGLSVEANGRRCRLAVIDDNDNIVEAGDLVARKAFDTAIACYRQFLTGEGHLRSYSAPPAGLPMEAA